MKLVEVKIDHELAHLDAMKRVKDFLVKAPKSYGSDISDFQSSWNGQKVEVSFKVMSTKVIGHINVDNRIVTISSKIPFAFLLFKSKIEKILKERGKEILKK